MCIITSFCGLRELRRNWALHNTGRVAVKSMQIPANLKGQFTQKLKQSSWGRFRITKKHKMAPHRHFFSLSFTLWGRTFVCISETIMRECWWSHIYVADIYEWVKFDADPSRNLEPADPNILFDSVWFTWAGPGVLRVAKVYIHTFIFMFLSIPKNEAIHDQLTGWQSVCCQSHMLHRDALSPETHWF